MLQNFYKNTIVINGKKQQFVIVGIDTQAKKEMDFGAMHHIQIIDRSGSMSWTIDDLVEHVKKTIGSMNDGDNLSVIWFSDSSKILIKGASKNTPNLEKTLDQLKSTIATTCFSKAFENVEICINDLPALPVANITLFTDGCPVVSWSDAEEERRVMEIINRIKDKAIMINCVGYGNYYNKEFLTHIADASLYGKLIHIEDVKTYSDIWKRSFDKIANVTPCDIKISAPKEIIVFSQKNSSMYDKTVEFNFLNNGMTYMVMPIDKGETVSFNGAAIDTSSLPECTDFDSTDMLYVMLYESYYKGKDSALDIAVTLKDKYFVDGILNAFTAKERQTLIDDMEKAVKDKTARMKDGTTPKGYVPKPDAFCVMDLINLLSGDENVYVPDMANYKRIGKKMDVVGESLFVNNNEEPKGYFSDLVLNESLLNVGIRFKIHGTVNVLPEDKPILPFESITAYMYNTHSIIKDGTLNVASLHALVTNNTLTELNSLKIKNLFVVNKAVGDKVDITIDLSKIPVVNRMYAKHQDLEDLTAKVYRLGVLKAKQKAIKTLITEDEKLKGDAFTPEQYKLLKDKYSIEKTMAYSPKHEPAPSSGDSYTARSIDFDIAGWSTIPKIEDVIKKKNSNKELKPMEKVIVESVENTKTPIEELAAVKEEIRKISFWLSTVKLGKILTGGFWTGLLIDGDKYKFVNSDGSELKVKLEYKTIML